MCRDGFDNTLNEICVVAVLGFKQVFTTTGTEALAFGIFGSERKSGSEVNTDGRDLVSPMTAISLRASCSMGCTNW